MIFISSYLIVGFCTVVKSIIKPIVFGVSKKKGMTQGMCRQSRGLTDWQKGKQFEPFWSLELHLLIMSVDLLLLFSDWITADVLKLIAQKGQELLKSQHIQPHHSLKIKAHKKSHIIDEYTNEKEEYQDCHGYSVSYLCTCAAPASLKRGNLEAYL